MKPAANLSLLYPGLPLAERCARAAADGFSGIEILFPYAAEHRELPALLRAHGLALTLINTPPGHAGERGLAALPGREHDFRAAFAQALDVAVACGCPSIHTMAGQVAASASREAALAVLADNLRWAAPQAASQGIVLTLEALNRIDMPGYAYWLPSQAIEMIERVGHPALRLQFDLFHTMREGLDPLAAVHACRPHIHHVQIAGAPKRDEPDLSEPLLSAALQALLDSGYRGWLGYEYHPRGDTREGLAWQAPLRRWIAQRAARQPGCSDD